MVYKIITFMLCFSTVIALFNGNFNSLSLGLSQGFQSSINLLIGISGGMCFWCGIAKILEETGVTGKLSKVFTPLLLLLFGKEGKSQPFAQYMSQNITANFLGLGNMATPMGLSAAKELVKKGRQNLVARLIVLNTASVQLLPTTLCTIRGNLGAKNPYDILPHVWISSVFSVIVGISLCGLLDKKEDK